jgi:ribosomal protein S19
MSRSLKKGPYINIKLEKKVSDMNMNKWRIHLLSFIIYI